MSGWISRPSPMKIRSLYEDLINQISIVTERRDEPVSDETNQKTSSGRAPMGEEAPADSHPTDFSQFALSQNFGVQANVIKRLTTVPVRKPSKIQWFRIHPEYKLDVWF